MNIKTKDGIKKGVTNFFGAIGYLFCFLQWLWAILLYFSVIQSVSLFFTPKASHQALQAPATSGTPSIFLIIFGIIVVIAVLAFTIYIFVKLPSTISKTGKKIVHKTADTVAPMVIKVQKKPDTKKFRIQLTAKLVLIIKIALIAIPLILAYTSRFIDKQVFDYRIAFWAELILAAVSFVFFAFQYLLAWLMHVKKQNIS